MYVLPNNTMYKRVHEHIPVNEMKMNNGLVSIRFSGNLGVIKTRPGYASSLAYDIDEAKIPAIIGTVAGDDTILMVLEEHYTKEKVQLELREIIGE